MVHAVMSWVVPPGIPAPPHSKRLLLAGALAVFAGCAQVPNASRTQIAALSTDLAALDTSVSTEEAHAASVCAFSTATDLATNYRLVRPPILHNVLVNLGLRKRGLCYQFAEDMEAQLSPLNLATLNLHWGIARAGTWREHNAVVITARNAPFEQGIVLDAWRNSGRLYWGPIASDRYPWQEGFPTESEQQP